MKIKPCPAMKVMALVTAANRFYSFLMFALASGPPDRWCVGGIKEVDPIYYDEVHAKLTD